MNFTVDMVPPLIEKMGVSKEELAFMVGVGSRTVHNWVTGKTKKIPRAARNNLIKLHKKWMVS